MSKEKESKPAGSDREEISGGQEPPHTPVPSASSSGNSNSWDSSDSEAEYALLREKKITDQNSFISYLMSEVIRIEEIEDPNGLHIMLGLTLHNCADRLFNSGELREVYKELKRKEMLLTEVEFQSEAREIEKFLTLYGSKVLTGLEKLAHETDTDIKNEKILQIYNYIFNPDIELPEGIGLKEGVIDGQAELKALMRKANKEANPNLQEAGGTQWGPGFTLKGKGGIDISLDLSDYDKGEYAKRLLAYSHLMRRRDRTGLKESEIKEVIGVAHSSIISSSSTSNITHTFLGKSETDVTLLRGPGRYSQIERRFGKRAEEISATATAIKDFIRGAKDISKPLDKIACLMFSVEVERSKATALASPMFLDEVERTGVANMENFPMEMEGAVEAARQVQHTYAHKLPGTTRFDERVVKSADLGKVLLVREGKLFINWLANHGSNKLENVAQALNCRRSVEKLPAVVHDKENFEKLREEVKAILGEGITIPQKFEEFLAQKEEVKDYLTQHASNTIRAGLQDALEAINTHIIKGWYNLSEQEIFKNKHANKEEISTASEQDNSISLDREAKRRRTNSLIVENMIEKELGKGTAAVGSANKPSPHTPPSSHKSPSQGKGVGE